MLVQQVLKAKSTEGVYTVTPDTSVREVARILAEKRIGGVVVSTNGQTAEGILSERDIVRRLAAEGAACLDSPASEVMTSRVNTCGRRDLADAVLTRMTEGRFRHMPVVEDGKLIGIVTIGDMVKARLDELSAERDALENMIAGH